MMKLIILCLIFSISHGQNPEPHRFPKMNSEESEPDAEPSPTIERNPKELPNIFQQPEISQPQIFKSPQSLAQAYQIDQNRNFQPRKWRPQKPRGFSKNRRMYLPSPVRRQENSGFSIVRFFDRVRNMIYKAIDAVGIGEAVRALRRLGPPGPYDRKFNEIDTPKGVPFVDPEPGPLSFNLGSWRFRQVNYDIDGFKAKEKERLKKAGQNPTVPYEPCCVYREHPACSRELPNLDCDNYLHG